MFGNTIVYQLQSSPTVTFYLCQHLREDTLAAALHTAIHVDRVPSSDIWTDRGCQSHGGTVASNLQPSASMDMGRYYPIHTA